MDCQPIGYLPPVRPRKRIRIELGADAMVASKGLPFVPPGTKVISRHWPGNCNSNRDRTSFVTDRFKRKLGKRILNAETKGFFIDRTADRGGHHPDHCSDRDSELAARPYGRQ